MTKDKRKDFENIIKFIDDKKYDEAVSRLNKMCADDDEEKCAFANYLLGYINTLWCYEQRNTRVAKQKLYSNINSNYPHPYAFVLYADIMEDNNVAENYLRKGIELFPKDSRIYRKLFHVCSDKDSVIQQILTQGFSDIPLLGNVISYLFYTQQWDKIDQVVIKMEKENTINEEAKNYLNLIKAYVLLFCEKTDFGKAKNIFKQVIATDIDNKLAYAHYVGIIYACIQLGETEEATVYFDKLPVTNSIYDFDDGPWPLGIYINFEKIYRVVFESISKLFLNDHTRKHKASALYALYLYSPSVAYDVYRYRKTDVSALVRFLKKEFNVEVAAALYNMRCHYRQFVEAYEILWMFLNEYEDPERMTLFFSFLRL